MGGKLAGKSIVVLGCARGIGHGAVRLLAREGARLALGDIDGEGAERCAAAIRTEGGDALAMAVDLREAVQVNALVERAAGAFGRIDGLANIAAATNLYAVDATATAIDITVDLWQQTLDINLTGPFHAIRAVMPHLLATGGGSIVNVTSVGGIRPQSFAGAYGVSKAGLANLTAHIAAAYGLRGVRCNAIAPGPIRTPDNDVPEAEPMFGQIRRFTPSPRLGRPEDIGAAIAFLLSDESGFINGEEIRVDGGAFCHAPWSAEVDFGTL